MLIGVESLEMVRLDSVSSKHRYFSLGVLGHEIVFGGEVYFVTAITGHHPVLVGLLVSLSLGHLGVFISDGLDHGSASGVMLVLGLSEKRSEVGLLLKVHLVIKSLLLSIKLLLSFLLGNPVCLL